MIGPRPSIVSLAVRVLVRDRDDDERLKRIVHMDGSIDEAWLKNLDDKIWPYRLSLSDFVADYERASPRYEIVFDEPRQIYIAPPNSKTATDKRQKEHWAIMQHLLAGADDDERALLFPITRRPLMATACAQFGVTRQTIVNVLIRYWLRGMTSDALRPDFRECGAPGVPRNIVSGAQAGRPRTISPSGGVSPNDELRRILQIGADYYFFLKNRRRMSDAIDYIVEKFFSNQVIHKDGHVTVEVFKKRPTERQLQYYIQTHYHHSHGFRARKGEKNWLLKGRAIVGHGDHGTQGPGDKYQIDATVADIYLVSQYDRRRIVGRPVIYFVIDVWSRLIVGVYVGFEGPSWMGAAMALINMVTPKVEFCDQYKLSIEFGDWPASRPPKTLLADKGELSRVGLTDLIEAKLRIQIENTPSGRADLKSIVERRFLTVPTIWKPFTPGYVETDYGQRGARDYRLDAKLNLYEFTQLQILSIMEHNAEPISGFRAPAELITDGRDPAPGELWNWGEVNRSGVRRHLTIDEVSLAVMPHDTARVTKKGISFRGAHYVCPTARDEDWFSLARRRSEWEVQVSYDPRRKEVLYLRDDRLPHGFEACTLVPGYQDCVGKSHFEAEELARAQKIQVAATADKRQEERIARDLQMKVIIKKAEKEAELVKDPILSKTERLSSIRENHADERSARRREEAIDLTPYQSPLSSPAKPSENEATTSDKIPYEDQSLEFLKHLKRESRE